MRPLAINPISGAPPIVLGVAVIRGEPTVVVDVSQIIGESGEKPERFVTVRIGARTLALALQGVDGVRAMPREQLRALPPLLADAGAVGSLAVDPDLVLVLDGARLVSEDLLRELESTAAR